jgi:hypothetical protein
MGVRVYVLFYTYCYCTRLDEILLQSVAYASLWSFVDIFVSVYNPEQSKFRCSYVLVVSRD